MIGVAFFADTRRVVRLLARKGFFFSIPLYCAGKPGLAPAGDSLSLASPRESKQREGDPQSGSPSGQPAVLKASGVWLNSLRSDNASPDPLPSALLGPARTGGQSPDIQYQQTKTKTKTKTKRNADDHQNSKQQKFRSHKYAPWRVLVGLGGSNVGLDVWVLGCPDFRTPRRNEEASSASADGSGLALFERSEFSQTPAGLSNAAYRRSRATNPARLSFAYFSLAKQRTSESPAGATPGLPARSTNQTQGKWHARLGAHPNATRPPWRTPARIACARPYPSRRESQK